jgi:hypothetical protein
MIETSFHTAYIAETYSSAVEEAALAATYEHGYDSLLTRWIPPIEGIKQMSQKVLHIGLHPTYRKV